MLTSSLKVFVLKCKPEEIYSLLQQTSSGHLRNCTFCRFNVGLSLLIRYTEDSTEDWLLLTVAQKITA